MPSWSASSTLSSEKMLRSSSSDRRMTLRILLRNTALGSCRFRHLVCSTSFRSTVGCMYFFQHVLCVYNFWVLPTSCDTRNIACIQNATRWFSSESSNCSMHSLVSRCFLRYQDEPTTLRVPFLRKTRVRRWTRMFSLRDRCQKRCMEKMKSFRKVNVEWIDSSPNSSIEGRLSFMKKNRSSHAN
jgi:hypothetical protein